MKRVIFIILVLITTSITYANNTSNDPRMYGIGASFARLAHVEGTVNVYRDSYKLEKAETNLPLNPLDVLKTSPDSRAVVQFIDGTLLKIGEDTKIEFLEIDGSKESFAMIVRLWSGRIYFDVEDTDQFGDRTYRIDTEEGTMFLLSHGQYRIDRNSYETDVKVVSGKIEVDVSNGATIVRSGEEAIVNSSGAIQKFVFNTFDRDDFDLWAANSYRRKVVVSERYVPVEIRSYVYELDSYGTWVYDDDFDVYVWRPYIVDVDWVPYSYGRWVWSPFGMTWVSYYPWGYAPFHYGYWRFSVSFGWVWVPDIWYSPAWVTWAYWDDYIGWYPCYYYRGRVVAYHVRGRRRIVYAPIRRFYRGGRYSVSPIPSNRRIVTVKRPILPDPIVLRKNPREAIVRAVRKPVTREIVLRRLVELRNRAGERDRRTDIGRVRDRRELYSGVRGNNGRTGVSREGRGNLEVIVPRERQGIERNRTIVRRRTIDRRERGNGNGYSHVIRSEGNRGNRFGGNVAHNTSSSRVIRSGRSRGGAGYSEGRATGNKVHSPSISYRQSESGERYHTIPVVKDRRPIYSSSSNTHNTYSNRGFKKVGSSQHFRGNSHRYIRISPRTYSSHSSHRVNRRR